VGAARPLLELLVEDGVDQLDEQFKEGPGGAHYEQMMDRNMTKVACGFYDNPQNGNLWFDIDFY
jgi:hypothetical protein